MSDRYTISEGPWGYETDITTRTRQYALTDNRPDKVSVWAGPIQGRILQPNNGQVPFRHLCYAAHKEDLEPLCKMLNEREG